MENCRFAENRKNQSRYPYDIVVQSDVPMLDTTKQMFKTSTAGVKARTNETGKVEDVEEAKVQFKGSQFSAIYNKPSSMQTFAERTNKASYYADQIKEGNLLIGDMNINYFEKVRNKNMSKHLNTIKENNLIPDTQPTWRNSRGHTSHTDFISKDVGNLLFLNWKESLNYDHPVITTYSMEPRKLEVKVCNKKLIDSLYYDDLVLNDALPQSYKYVTSKRRKINAKSYVEQINTNKITANARMKITSKVVTTIFCEDLERRLTDPVEVKNKIRNDFIFKLYGGKERDQVIPVAFVDLPAINHTEMIRILKCVNTAKAHGPDGITNKFVKS